VTVGDVIEPFTLRNVIERHGAEVWVGRTEAGGHLRLLLPLADAPTPARAASAADLGPRPLSFDLDLFAQPTDPDLANRPLTALPCTAFDTETTGLRPSEGDEILSLGAVRIVGGRLRREETFDVLVDPRRPIALSAVAVHGIEPEMVRGQPTITEVLPRFHRFAEGTALLGHNAAFDLRFLQLKEERAGVRFDHPVLDTLLLAGVLFPTLQDYSLDGLATKLGAEIVGRHTALGDALTTADVYLRLLPLLEAEGIITLADALEASQRTPLARLSY
jgi:DNA polymerase-3 subunit epsilon